MQRIRTRFLVLAVALFAATLASAEPTEDAPVDSPEPPCRINCFECHDVDRAAYAASVHRNNACTSCHTGITDVDRHALGEQEPDKPDCRGCHEEVGRDYAENVHNQEFGMACTDCHTEIHAQRKWDRTKEQIVIGCTQCHEKPKYVASGHSAAVLAGNQDAAACSDCHGLHNTHKLHFEADRFPEEARAFYNESCRRCHGDKPMMERNHLTTEAVDTYDDTYHGTVQKLGYPTHVAGCADCHAYHNILPPEDPKSTVNPANLVANCGRCHPRANANFVQYIPHADYAVPGKHPFLYWTFMAMTGLLVFVFLVFWAHSLMWWRKSYFVRKKLFDTGEIVDPKVAAMERPGAYYWRFKLFQRIMHVVLISSFFTLVVTGMPLRFADADWAPLLIRLLGGAHTAGLLHRAAAGILIVLFTGAFVMSVRFLTSKKNGATFWKRLFSPDSLFPRWKDVEDFKGMFLWFVNRGPEPEFDRWTYWEKFDFLAVFWGMAAIGVSGLFLWMPEATSQFLPGWIFNVAIIVHSDEAMLAAGFIFTVHFFNTHLIPTKFPMDYVIFTGRIRKWQFIEEKPLYWKRLQESGKLETMKAGPPSAGLMIAAGAFGLISILAGILITVLALMELIM